MNIKSRFLQSGLVVDNIYLDKYIELCSNPNNNADSLKETHHIFTRAASKILHQVQDDSPENLVILDIQNHCLAHYYLALCARNAQFKYGNITCLNWMTHRHFNVITEDWILNNLTLLNSIRKEQRRLNSELQIGKQAGLKNGNCKYSKEQCENIKNLLLENVSYEEIFNKTGVPLHIIKAIKNGKHWSCVEDNFKIEKPTPTKHICKNIKLSKKEKLQLIITDWSLSKHYCKNCGCECSNYVLSKNGNGEFCSKHCSVSWATKEKFKKYPQLKQKISENRRSYAGKNNPNYGKKASKETCKKISDKLKKSEGVKNSSRFLGHTHSDTSKRKTSESLKLTYAKKKSLK